MKTNHDAWHWSHFYSSDSERRCLIASAHVENALGCPVIMHPGRSHTAPFEMVRIYQEAGGRVDRLVMSHMDSTCLHKPYLTTITTQCFKSPFVFEHNNYVFTKIISFACVMFWTDEIRTIFSKNNFWTRRCLFYKQVFWADDHSLIRYLYYIIR